MAPRKHVANAMEIDRLATQLAKDPHSKAFLPLAEEYCKVGMLEEAVSVLEAGLKHYPGFITAMVALGRAYDQLNQPTKARAVLEGAIKLSPDNLRAHRTLIKIYAAQGLTQEALKSCRVILSMHPRDEEAQSVQASLGAAAAQQANDTASTHTDSAPAPEAQSQAPSARNSAKTPGSPVPFPMEDSPAMADELRSETGTSKDRAPRRAATIARLESWLHSLERRRRDRPASDIQRSNL